MFDNEIENVPEVLNTDGTLPLTQEELIKVFELGSIKIYNDPLTLRDLNLNNILYYYVQQDLSSLDLNTVETLKGYKKIADKNQDTTLPIKLFKRDLLINKILKFQHEHNISGIKSKVLTIENFSVKVYDEVDCLHLLKEDLEKVQESIEDFINFIFLLQEEGLYQISKETIELDIDVPYDYSVYKLNCKTKNQTKEQIRKLFNNVGFIKVELVSIANLPNNNNTIVATKTTEEQSKPDMLRVVLFLKSQEVSSFLMHRVI